MKKIKKFLRSLGPGIITGASDNDPSGISTYSQTGAQFGFSQLWTALFSFPFMAIIQEICGRIGLVTGKGLSSAIKEHYPKSVLYFAVTLVLTANIFNIGADLGAMAASLKLLLGAHFIVWLVAIVLLTLVLQIFVPYKIYANILKYFTLSLLAYFFTAFAVDQDWSKILHGTVIPRFSFEKDYLLNIVAILGTTISPYLFFWQASEEVEEEVKNHKLNCMGGKKIPKVNCTDVRNLRIDTIIGMLFSNLIMFFIMITTASTLGIHGISDIQTADQVAQALRPLAGDFAYLLFTLGIVGTGLLAIPVLAGSASYALSEILGWKEGLYRNFRQAHGFYGIIAAAILIGLLINLTPIPPFKLLYYTAAFNGICAPPLMIIIMLMGSNKKIMGKYVNSIFSNVMGWTITVLMAFCALALIISTLID